MMASIFITNLNLLKGIDSLQIEIVYPHSQAHLATLQITSSIVDEIKEHQKDDPELVKLMSKVKENLTQDFSVRDGVLWF